MYAGSSACGTCFGTHTACNDHSGWSRIHPTCGTCSRQSGICAAQVTCPGTCTACGIYPPALHMAYAHYAVCSRAAREVPHVAQNLEQLKWVPHRIHVLEWWGRHHVWCRSWSLHARLPCALHANLWICSKTQRQHWRLDDRASQAGFSLLAVCVTPLPYKMPHNLRREDTLLGKKTLGLSKKCLFFSWAFNFFMGIREGYCINVLDPVPLRGVFIKCFTSKGETFCTH